MRNSESGLIKERNLSIYSRYCEMYFTNMMREEAIWPELKKEFWLEEHTIYRIVLSISKKANNEPPQD